MRVTGPARLAVLALAASSSLALAAVPARAATSNCPVDPTTQKAVCRVGNDTTQTIYAENPNGFYNTSQESVLLRANPANGQADIPGTVTSTGSCSFTLNPNGSCAGPMVFTADLTDKVPGRYDIIETKTDANPFASPATTTTTDGQVDVYAQPRFTSMTPATRGLNSVSTVMINGVGFVPGVTASFGAGTTTSVVSVAKDQLTVQLTVAPDADLTQTNLRDVTLTSPSDGPVLGSPATDTKTGVLTLQPAPVISGVSPSSGLAGSKQHLVITGQHFFAGSDLALSIPQVDVDPTTLKVTSDTQIDADVTVQSAAPAGPRTIALRNGDGGRTTPGTSTAFTVIAPPGAPTAVRSLGADTVAYLAWTAPVDPGSGPVTGYRITYTAAGGQPATTTVTGTTAALTGLVNGTPYTVTVAAKNDVAQTSAGPLYGAESSPVTVTPRYATTLTAVGSAAIGTVFTPFTLSGRLTRASTGAPLANVELVPHYAPEGGKAYDGSAIKTASDGTYVLPFKSRYTTTVSVRYAGSSVDQPRTSAPVTFRVRAYVTISTPKPSSVSSSSTPLRIYGGITPNKAGRTIMLTRFVGSQQVLVARTVVASNGTYLFSVRTTPGTYTFVVTIGQTTGNLGGTARVTVRRT
ncbi:MAG: fibronectin type III domain-containing protein, partial [Nocardioidaceae bacterium]